MQIICEFFPSLFGQFIMFSFSDYCEVGFATRMLGDHIISFTREGNVSLGCTWDDYHKLDTVI